MNRLRYCGLLVWCLSFFTASHVRAADLYWDNTSGSVFPFYTDATFWSTDPALTMPAPAAPVASDNIFFLFNAAPYSVILSAGNAATDFTASDGDVTFTGPGGTLATSGTATIDDPFAAGLVDGAFVALNGPNWTSAGAARVGDVGFATLTVNGGSDLGADQFFIGSQNGGTGEVTVTGAGSTLNASGGFNVSLYTIGGNGGTGTLHVLAGADVTTTSTTQGDISIGEGAGSTGTLNIDGAGSTAESEDIWVGHGGTGVLNITSGGVINLTDSTATNRNFEVARTLLATGDIGSGSVLVSGDNSLLSVGTLSLGDTGVGTATVSGGGRVNVISGSNAAVVGRIAGSDGSLTVTGVGSLADSTVAVTGNLLVGQFGQGTLQAELGANVTVSGSLFIGEDVTNTSDNSVMVTGAGSLLTVGATLYVGNEAVGDNTPGSEKTNSLSVTDGATASAPALRVGEVAGSKGEMLVNGAGSSFSSTTNTAIGTRGTGTLEVSGGGILTNSSTFWVGYDGAGAGSVLVSAAGSVLQANAAAGSGITYIGGDTSQVGGVGSVTVENGGQFNTASHVFLGGNGSGDGTLLVTGPGSIIDSDDGGINEITYVGYANRGAFTIADGASADSEHVRIGELETVAVGEAAATVTGVNGTASTWNISGTLVVGNSGVGSLGITAGGQLISNATSAGISVIGNGGASDGSAVVIDGAGSKWTDAGGLAGADVFFGNSGGSVASPITLTVQNGGALETSRGVIARLAGSRADVVVTGNGSRWDATSVLVGNVGVGSLTVSGGGTVNSTSSVTIGAQASGVGTSTITGAGSLLHTDGTLTTGFNSNSQGAVNIEDGGAVTNTGDGIIASIGGSTGTVNVGNGSAVVSTWTNAASLFVGGSSAAGGGTGTNGTLNVNNRGSVSVANELKLWANGRVVLNGGTVGTLQLTTLTRVPGSTFDFQSGKLSFLNNAANNRVFDAAALADIFNADPTITSSQTLQALGPVTLSAPLRLNGGTLSVASVKPGSEAAFASNLDWDAGTLQFTGQGLTISPAGPLDNTVSLVPGQTLTVSGGGLTNEGSLNVIGATASFTGGPSTNNVGSEINAINATLDFTPGLTNNGVMNLINTSIVGSVSGGGGSAASYVGDNSVDGDLTMSPADVLQIRIGGTAAGEYDSLAVTGAAALDGTLAASLSGGFMPMLGDQFAVVTFASHTGDFDTYTGLELGGLLTLKPTFTPGSLVLKTLPAIDGDINLDGTVDIFDVNAVSANWSTPGPAGDANGDGIVDIFDVNLISANWGATGGGSGANAVPEPSTRTTASFAAISIASLIILRRRVAAS